MRHRKKYILLFLLLVVCAGLVFFYGIKSEGQEDKQEVLSSVEDTHQVPEAAVDSALPDNWRSGGKRVSSREFCGKGCEEA